MSWASKTYIFSASTIARSAEVNENFDDMVDQLNIAMPSGGIILWSGSTASIPSGYYLCDGANSTPDLRGRFIVGAGGAYNVADTGGEASHTLTESEMPVHTHVQNSHTHGLKTAGGDTTGSGGLPNTSATTTLDQATEAATAVNQNAGSGSAHENRPPYYALAYIMKS